MEREIRLEVHVVLRRMGRVRLEKLRNFAFEKLVCTTNAKLSLKKSQHGSVKVLLFLSFTPTLFEN